jgi:transposase/uncharacterized coiled-coil protein SlyX
VSSEADLTPDEYRRIIAEKDETVAQLLTQVAGLIERVAELERRLGANPRNSNTPPSAEGYTKPAPKSLRTRSGRKPGKQPGEDGTTLAQVADPDHTLTHRPESCAGCGASLADAEVVSVEARQVFDLPEKLVEVTEHRVEHRLCACGATTMAPAPAEVNAPAQYGPRTRAAGVYLTAGQLLPYQRAAQTMGDLLGTPVSPGSLAAWAGRAADDTGPFLETLRDRLAAAPVTHADESGFRVAGKLRWIHSLSTALLTLYHVHDKRGKKAMDDAGVLPRLGEGQVVVHDGWKPYRQYTGVKHSLCNAHHLRELVGVAEGEGQEWAASTADLLRDANDAVKKAKADGRDALDSDELAEIQRRHRQNIAAGKKANPARPGRKQTKAYNLLARLDTERDDVLRFTVDFNVPFDNNQAERDIRTPKLKPKISGCLRTVEGAEDFAALRSYLSTAAKHGHNLLDVLARLVQGDPWIPPAPA